MKDKKFPWSTILTIIAGAIVGVTIGVAENRTAPTDSKIVKSILVITHYARYSIFVFLVLLIISAFSLMKAEAEDLMIKRRCRAGMLIGGLGCICSGVLCMIVR